jgi:hypothetical protein
MMAEATNAKTVEPPRIVAGRSPAYPYISLSKAVERADKVREANAARATMTPETFYKIWELGPQSSGARQTLAALNHFGLVEYLGRGEERKVKLTDLALKIVLDKRPDSPKRQAALQRAALEPPIHRELFKKYGGLLPDKVVLESYLTVERGYNEQAASALVDEFKNTLAYAGLDKPGIMPPDDSAPTETPAVKVGDLVQWTSSGVDQFQTPKRILGIQTHEGKEWAFVEGEKTGVPMAELNVVAAGPAGPIAATPAGLPPESPLFKQMLEHAHRSTAPNARQEVFALDEGDVTLTFPAGLSVDSYNDLESYLMLFLKKAKRRAEKGGDPDKDKKGVE